MRVRILTALSVSTVASMHTLNFCDRTIDPLPCTDIHLLRGRQPVVQGGLGTPGPAGQAGPGGQGDFEGGPGG